MSKPDFHTFETQHLFVFHSVRDDWYCNPHKERPLDELCPERVTLIVEGHPKVVKLRAVTIVVAFDKSGRHALGEAYCSAKDQWNRRLGRTIAEGRALKALAAYGTVEYVPLGAKPIPPKPIPRKEAMAIAIRVATDRLRELGGVKAGEAS